MASAILFNNQLARGRIMRRRVLSEINVTPFVDIMLVLLVIFMVTAPLLTVGIPVKLPKTQATVLPIEQDQPLIITIKSNEEIWFQDTVVNLDDLLMHLQVILVGRDSLKIYLRADATVKYGRVVQLIGRLNSNGFRDIALVTDSLPSPLDEANIH